MHPYVAEFLGTMLLVLIGNGVCANASLNQTKGSSGANWVQISVGWALAVFVGVMFAGASSGAHLNPAVTVGLAAAGKFDWGGLPAYVLAQLAGAFTGALLVYFHYIQHFFATESGDAKMGCFCTGPAIRGLGHNLFSETVGTFVLVTTGLFAVDPAITLADGSEQLVGLGAVGAIPVALVVFAIGIALGGTTGYAINPARDFAPRLAHAILPMPNKRDSDWGYAWVPIIGPIAGGVAAAMLFLAVRT